MCEGGRARFIRLRIEFRGEFYEHGNVTKSSIKCMNFRWTAERVSASDEGLWFMLYIIM
jgi:hypothetical protein